MGKRFLVANFLRKAGLFWDRAVDNPQLLEAWFEELHPYTAKAIDTAMKKYFKSEEFFPVPGTLIPYIKDSVNYLEPTAK